MLAEWDPTNGSFIAVRRHDTLEAVIGDGLTIETVENERTYPQIAGPRGSDWTR